MGGCDQESLLRSTCGWAQVLEFHGCRAAAAGGGVLRAGLQGPGSGRHHGRNAQVPEREVSWKDTKWQEWPGGQLVAIMTGVCSVGERSSKLCPMVGEVTYLHPGAFSHGGVLESRLDAPSPREWSQQGLTLLQVSG